MTWKKWSSQEMNQYIDQKLSENINFKDEVLLGVPASHLDERVFSQEDTRLHNAPFLKTLVANPNHIGCHTTGNSESFFKGTHQIEREVIDICAKDILKGGNEDFDGYIASGGTEANFQAIWIYRNYFNQFAQCNNDQIALICSEDSHYSMDKAAGILGISIYKTRVNEDRAITNASVSETIKQAIHEGKNHFIVVCNMMTTMFGSVDSIDVYLEVLKSENVPYKIHVDGAYGGFYYPFSNEDNDLNFANPEVNSVTLDAHKMAQAPYGTGIFLIRKNFMKYANTSAASYVEGEDATLIGSRSGANAIAVWLILNTYGPYGWFEKIFVLQKRTDWLCDALDELNIRYYRNPFSNIVTIHASNSIQEIAKKFHLVPDNHHQVNWHKIVVMDHVNIEKLTPFIEAIKQKEVVY